jgi:hypothetical protein
MVVQLIKVSKGISGQPVQIQSDPALLQILAQLKDITSATLTNTNELKSDLAVHMDRQVSADEIRSIIRDSK